MNSLFDPPSNEKHKPRKPRRSPHVDRPAPRPIPHPEGATDTERAASAAVLSESMRDSVPHGKRVKVVESSLYALRAYELDAVARLVRDFLRS